MIYCYASRPHYFAHLQPVYSALPEKMRGGVFGPKTSDPWNTGRDIPKDGVVMVAADVDSRRFQHQQVIYVEHGAGQVYVDTPENESHGSYSGGKGHDNAILFLCPSETVADRWRANYRAPAVAVGCPKLDPWLSKPLREHPSEGGTVVFTFHWDNPLSPESRSALSHYQRELPAIVEALRGRGWRVLGHGHPRAQKNLSQVWRRLDVPFVDDFGYVLDHADVLVADNTSAMYEAATAGINVVALNAPWYRKDVHHGLRFWGTVPGRQVDMPDAVVLQIERAHDPVSETLRREAVLKAYRYADGKSSLRAAMSIMAVVDG